MHNLHNHVLPLKLYIGVFAALVALTVLTVLTASVDFGSWNIWVALAIANSKALLVLGIFMHLWFDSRFYGLILGVVLTMLSTFLMLTLMDVQWTAAVDYQHAIGLPRNEKVYRHHRQNPKASPLGPTLQPMQSPPNAVHH